MDLLDAVTHAVGANRKNQAHIAANLMPTLVITDVPEAPVRELLHLMTYHHINRIPIVESGCVIGIIRVTTCA